MSYDASRSQRGRIWQVLFLKMKVETMKKEGKRKCWEKYGNYQKQGKAKQTQKHESTEKVVRHKAGNFCSRRVQFPIWFKDAKQGNITLCTNLLISSKRAHSWIRVGV